MYNFSMFSDHKKFKARGEGNNNARFKEVDVIRIRQNLERYRPSKWAHIYSVSSTAIRDIIRRKSWSHLP